PPGSRAARSARRARRVGAGRRARLPGHPAQAAHARGAGRAGARRRRRSAMSLQGNLTDLAVVDLLQFVHLSGRSGTLHLDHDGADAALSFRRGNIVAAWGPTSPNVCDLLIAAGALCRDDLDAALAARAAEVPPPPLGQVLVARAAVTTDAL